MSNFITPEGKKDSNKQIIINKYKELDITSSLWSTILQLGDLTPIKLYVYYLCKYACSFYVGLHAVYVVYVYVCTCIYECMHKFTYAVHVCVLLYAS